MSLDSAAVVICHKWKLRCSSVAAISGNSGGCVGERSRSPLFAQREGEREQERGTRDGGAAATAIINLAKTGVRICRVTYYRQVHCPLAWHIPNGKPALARLELR
ncbi:hypothetical protein NL676_024947 [Syzygium grande]|nr:hypothetical protein NL676_024947 [Syzygium grande]